jgi:phosphatidylglycerophosphate synthase
VRIVGTSPIVGFGTQLALLAGVAETAGLSGVGWLAGVVTALLTCSLVVHGMRRTGTASLGPAGRVTLVRGSLVVAAAALVADAFVRATPVPALTTLAVVALVLDGVDGWVARRTRTVSNFGARFDMEIDAFLIFVLSVHVARSAGLWVLAIGLARYTFLAASWALPWLRETSPPRYWCKVVAVIQGVALVVGVAGVLPAPTLDVVLVAALILLAESFGRQVAWLWRHRPVASAPRRDPVRVMAAAH